MTESLSLAEARRIAVASQLRPGRGKYKSVLERLGCIQLDTISSVRRAHELALLARDVELDEVASSLERRRSAVGFEYWAHAMSVLPVSAWPYFAWRRESWRQVHAADHALTEKVNDEVRAMLADQGSITVSDFPKGAMHRGAAVANMGDSWNLRTDHKHAVERMLWFGEVACTHRIGFKRVYQLAERAIPAKHFWDADEETCLRHVVGTALRNLGVATTKDIADYFRLRIATVERVLRDMEIEEVKVEGWKGRSWIDPAARRLRRPATDRVVAVSMFDQLVWLRERMERLWGHDWKIEIYVPAAKRTFGYYCLPVFVGDDLPGRVALRRNNGDLVVEAVQWDEERADREHLHAAVDQVASWVDAEVRWEIARVLHLTVAPRGRPLRFTRDSCRTDMLHDMTPSPRIHHNRRLPATAFVATAALVLSVVTVASTAQAQSGPKVLVSEMSNAGPAGSADEIIELTNYGDAPADLDGWKVYRCAATGSRAYDPQLPPLESVTLQPGETFLIANAAGSVDDADAYYEVSLANTGFGVRLEDPDRNVIDAVAVYADPVDSECAIGDTPLPNDLNGVRDQTWQRTGDTGVLADDFVRARRTAGERNATEPDQGVQPSDVLVSELTNGGPSGSSDNFVEFANFGDEPADVGGWRFFRCWGSGRTTPGSLQSTIPAGTVLEPGEVFVAAHNSVAVPVGVPHARYSTSLSNAGFGALLVDTDGNVRDSVGVYEADGYHQPPTGSPCTQGTALPNRLDYGWNQTWQRIGDTGDNAADFAKAERSIGEHGTDSVTLVAADPQPVDTGVRVSELVNAGPAGGSDEFFELANFGDEPVSLAGWKVHRCQEDGRRNATPQIPVIDDVVLDPGETYLAVHTGSSLYSGGAFDASYDVGLAGGGFGLMVLDADGALADSVGVYDAQYSPCTQGLSLVNIVGTGSGETLQRFDATDYNADDFVPAERTPGSIPDDLRRPGDFTDEELAPVDVDPAARPLAPETATELEGRDAELIAAAEHTTGDDVDLAFTGAERIDLNDRSSRVFTGVSAEAPPTARVSGGETSAEFPGDEPLVTEAVDGFPFQRFELKLASSQRRDLEVTWSGTSTGTNELQMYAWNHRQDTWDLIAAGGGLTGGQITLTGAIDTAAHTRGRNVDILVQDGPATAAAFADEAAEPNRAFKDPSEYDLAFGYVTDTQFLSEGYRSAYAEMARWIATNAEARDIEYTAHTGDVIQNWLNGTHSSERAVDEYEFASDTMEILEDAGQPYGVIPGNHDTKWGREGDLYNQYFPAERFADQPWYGGAWRSDDAQNHYDVFEVDGAKFLFLYLGYFAGEEAIEWSSQVLADHPDHNVVFATHEYLHPDGSLSTPDNYRWTSMADRYWNEIVLPNDNVFMVIAGHHHGIALNIKRDVGGVDGRVVVEMMANYQGFQDEGDRNTGFMRLLQIDVDSGLMAVNTYSPLRDEHNAWEYTPDDIPFTYDDADDEFTVEVDLNAGYAKRIATDLLAPHAEAGGIGTAQAGAGETATVTWSGLDSCTDYVWFAEASDGAGRLARSAAATVSVPGRGGRECD